MKALFHIVWHREIGKRNEGRLVLETCRGDQAWKPWVGYKASMKSWHARLYDGAAAAGRAQWLAERLGQGT